MPKPLLACPFCRELFTVGETDGTCPDCGLPLRRLEDLPPSHEAQIEDLAEAQPTSPEDELLPATYLGRGRGAMVVLALLGLACFLLPWVHLVSPYTETISGFGLARRGAGYLWAGAAAWFVTIPLVASRRTIRQLRGVRLISAGFAAVTSIEVAMLALLPTRQSRYVAFEYDWAIGLYLSLIPSWLGVYVGARLGGRVGPAPASVQPRASGSHTLH